MISAKTKAHCFARINAAAKTETSQHAAHRIEPYIRAVQLHGILQRDDSWCGSPHQ
jgi:hypothetical protein